MQHPGNRLCPRNGGRDSLLLRPHPGAAHPAQDIPAPLIPPAVDCARALTTGLPVHDRHAAHLPVDSVRLHQPRTVLLWAWAIRLPLACPLHLGGTLPQHHQPSLYTPSSYLPHPSGRLERLAGSRMRLLLLFPARRSFGTSGLGHHPPAHASLSHGFHGEGCRAPVNSLPHAQETRTCSLALPPLRPHQNPRKFHCIPAKMTTFAGKIKRTRYLPRERNRSCPRQERQTAKCTQ